MAFIANAAVAEAKRVIEQNMRIRLCQEDALAFVHELERPVKVNKRFLRAARRYKETITDENKTFR
ncbi:hypothetical protein CE143_21795 [Photorhabdus luminescens]|uniref:DUF1778 domain-containing protein n=1 Tax=Photorhabdus akhurstii TaxID=171438 RepID=A0ABX8LYC6_9GAMM|nr:DUF1778 domain-containing protein [Photorhabdus akhurstii]QXF35519.1 hypothetical protein B0X70_21750 [Photorhabdus akhurstii]UJD77351.1 hypothetical protein CE143_21795 [Photorhabdus luminescens]